MFCVYAQLDHSIPSYTAISSAPLELADFLAHEFVIQRCVPNFASKLQAIVKILMLGPRLFLAFFHSALLP